MKFDANHPRSDQHFNKLKIPDCPHATECVAYKLTYNQGHSQRYFETCIQV